MNALRTLPVVLLVGATFVPLTTAEAAAPTCDGMRATIVGTSGPDRLVGTPRADVVVALGGDDVVLGRDGDDRICGGQGADVLRGGPGDDRLRGQTEAFHRDRGGRYFVSDLLEGGPGDDLLDVGGDARGVDWGDHGLLDFSGAGRGVTVDLAAGTATGQGRDTVVARPAPDCRDRCFGVLVLGSRHGDRLRGSADADQLVGGRGEDHLDGRGGNDELRAEGTSKPEAGAPGDDDTLTGGTGHDLLVAWIGEDALYGDAGDDTVWSLGGGPSEVFGGQDDDEVVVWFPTSPAFLLDGGEGDDTGQVLAPRRAGMGGRPESVTYDGSAGTATADGTTWGRIGTVEELLLGGGIRWTCEGTGGTDVRGCVSP